jgi:cytochrome b6-f complex iron-sulfur subunit
MEKHSRRKFLQLGAAGIGLAMAFLWDKLTLQNDHIQSQKQHIFPFDKNKEVTFLHDYIIINKDGKTEVFSSHCTHLGCVINKEENGRLVCPCHGSQYNLNGNAVKGPAYKPLEKLTATLSKDGTHIDIKS